MKEKYPSEIVGEFLEWLKKCQTIYDNATYIVNFEEEKEQDFLHALEFETSSKKRNKIATAMHESRVKRREAKERIARYGKLVKFIRLEQSKKFLGQLKGLVKEIKTEEDSLMKTGRTYHPRTDYGKQFFMKEGEEAETDRGHEQQAGETQAEKRDLDSEQHRSDQAETSGR